MGMRPCEIHGGRYVGPANHVYPAIIQGDDRKSARLSCCANCHKHVVDWAEVHLEQVTDENGVANPDEAITCPECKELAPEGEALIFLTSYKSHSPRRDFFGRAHFACASALEVPLGIAVQASFFRPLTAA